MEETIPSAMNLSSESEILSALQSAAFVDRSEVGRILVTGVDRMDFLHRLSTNDLASLKVGETLGTAFTTEKGRMVDYVTVCVRDSSLLLLTSARIEQQFLQWLEKYHIMEDISFSSVTAKTLMATIVGPAATSFASKIFESSLPPNTVVSLKTSFGEATIVCVQEFHTAMVHVIVNAEQGASMWGFLRREEETLGIPVMGAESYDAFRISNGIPVGGKEISEDFNPYDCGLSHAISFTKGCYVGQEVIARLDTYQKVQRGLIGIVSSERPVELESKIPLSKGTEEVGWLTSLSQVSIKGKYPGLAIVKKSSITGGQELTYKHGDNLFAASVSELPITY